MPKRDRYFVYTSDVIHVFQTPLIAAFVHKLYGKYSYTKLWECEGDLVDEHIYVAGVRKLTTLRQIKMPNLTAANYNRFALATYYISYMNKSTCDDHVLCGIEHYINRTKSFYDYPIYSLWEAFITIPSIKTLIKEEWSLPFYPVMDVLNTAQAKLVSEWAITNNPLKVLLHQLNCVEENHETL